MTTTVKVLIEGNKACQVKVVQYTSDGREKISPDLPKTVKPGSFATVQIHGEQWVEVVETGEFLS
jgi:hypothetical protein